MSIPILLLIIGCIGAIAITVAVHLYHINKNLNVFIVSVVTAVFASTFVAVLPSLA